MNEHCCASNPRKKENPALLPKQQEIHGTAPGKEG